MVIKCDRDPLAVDQNNYVTKIVHGSLFMIKMLGQEILLTISNFKICFFSVTSIVTSNKRKRVYGGYGITFYAADSLNFGNDFVKNVVIFVIITRRIF